MSEDQQPVSARCLKCEKVWEALAMPIEARMVPHLCRTISCPGCDASNADIVLFTSIPPACDRPQSNKDGMTRLNNLIDNGWLPVVRPTELTLWCLYNSLANDDGICRTPKKTLSNFLGCDETHIRRAKMMLVALGLLERVPDPQNPNQLGLIVRVLMPSVAPSLLRAEEVRTNASRSRGISR